MGDSIDLTSLYPNFGEYQGWGTPQVPTYSPANPSGTNVFDAIMAGVKSASGILGTRYSVPQLNPGQLIQTGPGGTTMYQGGPNSMYPTGLPSLSSFGGSGSMLPLLLIGGVVLFAIMKK